MHFPAHGANAASLYAQLQLPIPSRITDVSENVNSNGLPIALQQLWPTLLTTVAEYPHEQAAPFLQAVATHHQLPTRYIQVSNGAAESLMVLAQFFRGQTVALLEPSFSEYRRTLMQHGCEILSIVTTNVAEYSFSQQAVAQALQRAQALYICNPNNPTGVVQARQWIEQLLQHYPHVYIVVDEAFIDWTDEQQSVIDLVPHYQNLIVLRSMTKMYALAGVRLGYVLSQTVPQLRGYFPHWNVSGIAIALGCECLKQRQFVEQSRQQVAQLRQDMQRCLQQLGCTVTKSEANFLTFCLPARYDADDFYFTLLQQGIVLRHTKNYVALNGKWFRIAVKNQETWQICNEAIEQYVQNN